MQIDAIQGHHDQHVDAVRWMLPSVNNYTPRHAFQVQGDMSNVISQGVDSAAYSPCGIPARGAATQLPSHTLNPTPSLDSHHERAVPAPRAVPYSCHSRCPCS